MCENASEGWLKGLLNRGGGEEGGVGDGGWGKVREMDRGERAKVKGQGEGKENRGKGGREITAPSSRPHHKHPILLGISCRRALCFPLCFSPTRSVMQPYSDVVGCWLLVGAGVAMGKSSWWWWWWWWCGKVAWWWCIMANACNRLAFYAGLSRRLLLLCFVAFTSRPFHFLTSFRFLSSFVFRRNSVTSSFSLDVFLLFFKLYLNASSWRVFTRCGCWFLLSVVMVELFKYLT